MPIPVTRHVELPPADTAPAPSPSVGARPPVTVERDGRVARIVLDRPDSLNAIDLASARTLLRIVVDLESDPTCSVIVVSAAGRAFCTGGDIAAIMSDEHPDHYIRDVAATAGEAFRLLHESSSVVVCVVDGIAAGAGIAFALAADIVLASPSAVFLSAYGDVGLAPDCGVTTTLPRTIGRRRALEFVLSGRPVRAAEALEWQLVTEVVPRADLGARVDERVRALAARPPHVAAAAKALLRTDALDMESRIAEETDELSRMLAIPETRALLDAEYARQAVKAARRAAQS